MSRSLNLAVIPGDGIGQEVVTEGLKVLAAALPQETKLETKEYDFGAKRYHATGQTLTDADLAELKAHDALHPERGVEADLGGDLVGRADPDRTAGARVGTFRALADHHEVDVGIARQGAVDTRI